MKKIIIVIIFIFTAVIAMAQTDVSEQEKPVEPTVKYLLFSTEGNAFTVIHYKNTKPDDVPQEVYDGLWEIQKEVIDNFTYDFAVMRGRKKSPYKNGATKEDYYKYGSGVCEDYTNFFILLAREKGLTKNLYKISGHGRIGGHAWLEYRTAENVYIIDPTWSDDYPLENSQTRQRFRETEAYGKEAFFITYDEDVIIFTSRLGHSAYTNKSEVKLWTDNATDTQ